VSQRLVVSSTGRVVADRVSNARTFAQRGRGLLGRDEPGPREALVIHRARQVHTFGMRYPIDVCFCDRAWRVLHVVSPMRPNRLSRWVPRAAVAVEMRAGAMSLLGPGAQLSVEELSDL
jgi:uncharacterized membrane protein (UPF0127 family)